MSITVLTGLSGSGKSRRLIELVNAALNEGRYAQTFVCSEFPWPSNHGAFWTHRRLVCGQPGLTCKIDNFVSGNEAATILAAAPPGSLAAIEEAYAFGEAAVDNWKAAAARAVDVVVAAPSGQQLRLLEEEVHMAINLTVACQRCGFRDAEEVVIVTGEGGTLSVCEACFDQLAQTARSTIVQCLRDEHPFPGEDALYQPIDLPEVEDWRLARRDSVARADAMANVLEELAIGPGEGGPLTYLDVGCCTGLFCDYFARRGIRSKGVDATERFITVARQLDAYFRRRSRPTQELVRYEQANAYEYLRDTQQERFDVTSAFAVFQWIMIQRTPEHGLECLEWLSSKTKRVCFLEFGYTREEMYKDVLEVEIDREWVQHVMRERGGFSDIRVIDAVPNGLQRDLFVGVK